MDRGEEEDSRSHGLLYGDVNIPQTGQPLGGAEVRVEWRDPTRSAETVTRWRTGTTRPDGRYYLCWISEDVELSVRVTAADVPTRRFPLHLESPIQRRDVR